MSVLTNFMENIVLNAARGVSTTAPATLYCALFLSDPTETGTAGTEASYNGYARQSIAFSTPANSNNVVSMANTGQVIFPTPDAAAGTVTYAALFDAASGGNMLLYKALNNPIVLTSETSPRFGVSEFTITGPSGNMDPTFKVKVLNFLRGTSLTGFTPYLAMYDGDPTASGNELSGTGYARIPLTFDTPVEQASGQMMMVNTNAAASGAATSNWGTWAYGVIMTALSGGDRYYYKSNVNNYEMKNGAQAYIVAGTISVAVN